MTHIKTALFFESVFQVRMIVWADCPHLENKLQVTRHYLELSRLALLMNSVFGGLINLWERKVTWSRKMRNLQWVVRFWLPCSMETGYVLSHVHRIIPLWWGGTLKPVELVRGARNILISTFQQLTRNLDLNSASANRIPEKSKSVYWRWAYTLASDETDKKQEIFFTSLGMYVQGL